MKIYGFPTFNISKVLLAAEFIGLDYEYVALDPAQGDHKTQEHLLRHPLGKAPVLEHEGRFFFESAAICRYLARISDSALYKGDALQLAEIDQWLDLFVSHLGRWMGIYFWQEVVRATLLGAESEAGPLAEAKGFLDEQLPILEKRLSQNTYICGEQMSLADLIGAAYVQISEVTSLDISAHPAIRAWFMALRGADAYQRAMSHFPNHQLFSAVGSDVHG